MNINCEKINDLKKYEDVELTKEKLEYAFKEAQKKIDKNLDVFKTVFPSHASVNNVYSADENNKGWNQGFWTGILWLAYEITHDEKYRKTAEMQIPTYTKRIQQRLGVDHHDMGFLYTPSCVAAYKLTNNEEAKKTAIMAAENLLSRYHEKGQFIQAWGPLNDPNSYRLIIDCLLNIPLMYWAAEVTGDKKFDDAAYKHFNSTAYNIVRNDGSTYHTFYFNYETGEPLKGVTAQGFSDDSCWSRGQAWGIYGLMLTYKYKKDQKALELFKPLANYYLNRLPEDYISYWDLCFTDGDEPRDSSSAAIAACGLMEACKYLPSDDKDRKVYFNAAKRIINSLIDNYLTKDIEQSNGLLLHAVYGKPQNSGVDECNIWGDYFYMEALARLLSNNNWELYW